MYPSDGFLSVVIFGNGRSEGILSVAMRLVLSWADRTFKAIRKICNGSNFKWVR